jgi:polysaccharide biosynthesis/export protein
LPQSKNVIEISGALFITEIILTTLQIQHKMNNTLWKLAVSILIAVIITSCTNTRSATYFVGQKDAEIPAVNETPKAIIQSSDVLNINVTSMSTQPNNLFNISNASASLAGSNSFALQSSGYLVNREGYIKLPYLGDVKAAGLSSEELEDSITNGILAQKLMIDPIVTVRHLNFKVTVLGEVMRPTVINVPNEKISILEALGMAGDLTIYAKRNNILLVREEGGKKITKRLNLNSNDILTSPYYYLKANDVIYVEPNSAKVSSTSQTRQILPMIFGALSFVVVVVDRLVSR